ncbi:CRISPR-associated helicase/endonuclease Cas3 [Clostridia bacterium]|nr:CRISPR-associated helicase/endonuclease Cas3 [Clostridia bacterium]
MTTELYAHTKADPQSRAALPESEWQTLPAHLNAVSSLAQAAAEAFGAGELARAAGLLHDIGKATEAFQLRLRGKRAPADHKTEGARQAVDRYGKLWGKILAYIICGHHGGLPNDITTEDGTVDLQEMLKRPPAALLSEVPTLPADVAPRSMTASKTQTHQAFYITMLIRMVFSALVDADYLDTEAFMDAQKASLRQAFPPLAHYSALFAPKLQELQSYPQDNPVNIARRGVLNACLDAAAHARGFFKLTVPTGGGKTLSSLAFALEHAKKHGMARIVYAIPFTSITEQNANVFRGIFGDELVLEHHSNVGEGDSAREGVEDDETDRHNRHRLAAENWDAPLVVTTNVQLFESLFAAKPGKARKIHNLANAVIILDEAQTLPDSLLLPTLAALKSLVADFGATVVFCTATQPSIDPRWIDGMPVREIIPDTEALFSALSRTQITALGALSDGALAERLRGREQALCIVNTRTHARRLFALLGEADGNYHLSAVMCPEHRTKVLAEIKERLKNHQRCVVVSTQLIEAGVDIDFPCVYRAAAGIDAIAQAAGRCNREGKRTLGEVFVFTPEAGLPKGWFQRMAALGEEVMGLYPNPLLPGAVTKFFDLRYGLGADLDKKQILCKIKDGSRAFSFSFREMAEAYRLIEDKTIGIIIPYDERCREILREAEASPFPMKALRRLQRYSVSVYGYEFDALGARGCVRELTPESGVYVLHDANRADFYDEKLGLLSGGNWSDLII